MRRLFIFVCIVLFNKSFGQNSSSRIDSFKDLKLNTAIALYPDFIKTKDFINRSTIPINRYLNEIYYIEKNQENLIYVGKKYSHIGEYPILFLLVDTYKDMIFRIRVLLNDDYEIVDMIRSELGEIGQTKLQDKSFEDGKVNLELFKWRNSSNELMLTYKHYYNLSYSSKVPSGVTLTYESSELIKEIEDDKIKSQVERKMKAAKDF